MNNQNKADILKSTLSPIEWTPEMLLSNRIRLGLSRKDIADLFGISVVTVRNLEMHKVRNPIAVQGYGMILERYWAAKNGCVPAFRKVGESKYREVRL